MTKKYTIKQLQELDKANPVAIHTETEEECKRLYKIFLKELWSLRSSRLRYALETWRERVGDQLCIALSGTYWELEDMETVAEIVSSTQVVAEQEERKPQEWEIIYAKHLEDVEREKVVYLHTLKHWSFPYIASNCLSKEDYESWSEVYAIAAFQEIKRFIEPAKDIDFPTKKPIKVTDQDGKVYMLTEVDECNCTAWHDRCDPPNKYICNCECEECVEECKEYRWK